MLTKRDREILKFVENLGGITIYQAALMYWKGHFAQDQARKRLKKLYEQEFLKRYRNNRTKEYVYCFENTKQLTPHDIFILDFYANLKHIGAEILEYKKGHIYHIEGEKRIIPDAFFKFKLDNDIFGVLLEVDFTHRTNLQKYVPYFNGYFKKLYGGNPLVCIITENPQKVENINYDVVFLDYDLTNFYKKVLG